MVISIISQKGGVGKSTVAINLALAFASLPDKPNIALVDADEQRSCLNTLSEHHYDNLSLYEAIVKPHKIIENLKHKIIVVDTPPHSNETAYQAAAVSELVVIPCQPSPLDLRALAPTIKALFVIKEQYNPNLLCRFLVNRVQHRTTLSNEIRETLERLYPLVPVLKTVLYDRQAYKQSLLTGLSVIDFDRRSLAALEIYQLLDEIKELI